jgi:hypothetical protein
MRSQELILERYDTDKVKNRYLENYDPLLEPWVNKEVALLEIGLHRGGSLLLWQDYFQKGKITGIDIHLPPEFQPTERIKVFEGDQADSVFLSKVAEERAPDGYDIIIDDASHIGEFTKKAFWHLFDNHLKPGGLYVIEDWYTGYWEDWPDGKQYMEEAAHKPSLRWRLLSKANALVRRHNLKVPSSLYRLSKKTYSSHNYGMVGFIKQLVDEQAATELTKGRSDGTPQRQSRFESILVTQSIVFVKKQSKSGSTAPE